MTWQLSVDRRRSTEVKNFTSENFLKQAFHLFFAVILLPKNEQTGLG